MWLQLVQRQPKDKFYSQIFQFGPALAHSRIMSSKSNSNNYILTLTFSLAKALNRVLQLLLTANRLLDLTARMPYFLLCLGLQNYERVSVLSLSVMARNINMQVRDFKFDSGQKPQKGIIKLPNQALYKVPSVCLQ